MSMFDNLKDKAKEFLGQHSDKVEGLSDQGIAKVGDAADTVTGGKFSGHIDAGQDAADKRIGEG